MPMRNYLLVLIVSIFCFGACNSLKNGKKDSAKNLPDLWRLYHTQMDSGLYQQASETAYRIEKITESDDFFAENIKAKIKRFEASSLFESAPSDSFLLRLNQAFQITNDPRKKAVLGHLICELAVKKVELFYNNNPTLPQENIEELSLWSTENTANFLQEKTQLIFDLAPTLKTTPEAVFSELTENNTGPISFDNLFEYLAFNQAKILAPFTDFSNLPDSVAQVLLERSNPFVQHSFQKQFNGVNLSFLLLWRALESGSTQMENNPKQIALFLERTEQILTQASPLQRLYFKNILFKIPTQNNPVDAAINFSKANFLFRYAMPEIGSTEYKRIEDTGNEIARFCQLALQYNSVYGVSQAENLLNEINRIRASLKITVALTPKSKIPVKATFKNVDSAFVYFKKVNALSPIKADKPNWPEKKMGQRLLVQPLPYAEHTVSQEILTPEKPGYHQISLVSYSAKDSVIEQFYVWVSELSFTPLYGADNEVYLLAKNIATGKDFADVKVHTASALKRDSNTINRGYKIEQTLGQTGSKGLIKLERSNLTDYGQHFMLTFEGDTLITQSNFFTPQQPKDPEKTVKRIQFYTDKGIYQPGETVSFKGIISELPLDGSQGKVAINQEVKVDFLDANFQSVKSEIFKSNAFGSISGKFKIPENVLAGNFRLSTPMGQKFIRVEPIDVPSHEILLEKPRNLVKANDTFILKGKIKRLSGEPASGGTLNFYYNTTEHEIYFGQKTKRDQGTVQINNTDEFSITFNTFSANLRHNISLQYTSKNGKVTLSELNFTTNNSGENISVSNLKNLLENQELKPSIFVKNIFGEPLETSLDFFVERLNEPAIFDNLYKADFNFTSFKNEKSWALQSASKGLLVKDGQSISLGKLAAGNYRVIVKQNNTKILEQEISVYSEKPSVKPNKESFYVRFNADTTGIIVGTILSDVTVIMQAGSDNNIYFFDSFSLNKNQRLIPLPQKQLEGGNEAVFSFVALHKGYSLPIENPFANLELKYKRPVSKNKVDFSFSGFRENVSPGEAVEFNVKVNSTLAEPFELAASLFDEGLNQISPNHWTFPINKRFTFNRYPALRRVSFSAEHQISVYGETKKLKEFTPKTWPSFIWTTQNTFNFGVSDMFFIAPEEDSETPLLRATSAAPPAVKSIALDDEILEKSIRKNFNSTAFFYPAVRTQQPNEFLLKFTMPDNLTRWQLNILAHNKNLEGKVETKTITTKIPLFVEMGRPAFFRANDEVDFPVSLYTNTQSEKDVVVQIKLLDALTQEDITQKWLQGSATQLVKPSASGQNLSFRLNPKQGSGFVKISVKVLQGNNTDEEVVDFLVLPEKITVTEGFSFLVQPNTIQNISYQKLIDNANNPNLHTNWVHINVTENAFWEVAQILPAAEGADKQNVMEAATKLYILFALKNTLAKNPELAVQIDLVSRSISPKAMDKLSRFSETKNLGLHETPWASKSLESQENFALLAQMLKPNAINNEIEKLSKFLVSAFQNDSQWPWIKGGFPSDFITQNICFLLHDIRFNLNQKQNFEYGLEEVFLQALKHTELQLTNHFKRDKNYRPANRYNWWLLRYQSADLLESESKSVLDLLLDKELQNLFDRNVLEQATLLKVLFFAGKRTEGNLLAKSLLDRAVTEGEATTWGALEDLQGNSQKINALLALWESLHLFYPDNEKINGAKNALLLNKKSNFWGNSLTTAKVANALLANVKLSAPGSGGTQLVWAGEYITPQPGNNVLQKTVWQPEQPAKYAVAEIEQLTENLGWGGIIWQYETSAAHLTASEQSDVTINRRLVYNNLENTSANLMPVENKIIPFGSRAYVELIVTCNQAQSMITLSDYFPAGFSIPNSISGRNYHKNFNYYLSPSKSVVNLFIDYLPKGQHRILIPFNVTQKGSFESGYCQLQSFISPDLSVISNGLKGIRVE
jgi:hypothetical protein